MRESQIQTKIMKFLRKRPNTVTFKIADRFTSGIPDIIHLEAGRAYFFEVKTETGKTTLLQEAVLSSLRKAHCVALVVRSVEDVKEELK